MTMDPPIHCMIPSVGEGVSREEYTTNTSKPRSYRGGGGFHPYTDFGRAFIRRKAVSKISLLLLIIYEL